MHLKGQPRGIYSRTSKKVKQRALEMKEQGFKNKQISDETGIKLKTLYSLPKVKKSKFGPITDRIKIIYVQRNNNVEQISPLKIIKKKIKKIIDSRNDQQLTELIINSPKKFDSSNRRVIDRISTEIYENQLEIQQNSKSYSYNEEETHSNEISIHSNEQSIRQDQESYQYIGQDQDWIFQNFESNPPFFEESERQMEGNSFFFYPNYIQNQKQENEQEEQNWIPNFESNPLFSIEIDNYMEENSYKLEGQTERNSFVCKPILDWNHTNQILSKAPNHQVHRQNEFD